MRRCEYCQQLNSDAEQVCHKCGGRLPLPATVEPRYDPLGMVAIADLREYEYTAPPAPDTNDVVITTTIHKVECNASCWSYELPRLGIIRQMIVTLPTDRHARGRLILNACQLLAQVDSDIARRWRLPCHIFAQSRQIVLRWEFDVERYPVTIPIVIDAALVNPARYRPLRPY